MTGLLGGLFRLALAEAGAAWEALLVWARDLGGWRLALPVLAAAVAVGLARLSVRWSPEAAGSGVKRVEAIVRHEGHPASWRAIRRSSWVELSCSGWAWRWAEKDPRCRWVTQSGVDWPAVLG